MFHPPVKNPVPTIFNLYTDPREEKPTADSWVVGPILKIVREFEQCLKRYPPDSNGNARPLHAGQMSPDEITKLWSEKKRSCHSTTLKTRGDSPSKDGEGLKGVGDVAAVWRR